MIIAPSLLSADFSKLSDELKKVKESGCSWIHLDIMDGHFVPNLTFGPEVVAALRPQTDLFFDTHLMVENPERWVEPFAKAGSDLITFHIEATNDPRGIIDQIKSFGKKVGITLRPGTELKVISPFVADVDLVLVMTVEPGFGGQSFLRDQVRKVSELRRLATEQGYKYWIEVDGGINSLTAKEVAEADILVSGSYLFAKGQSGFRDRVESLK